MSADFKLGQPRFLTKPEILALHSASLVAYGGAEGFVNEGLLDSALAQPSQGVGGQYAHQFPFEMAAAYGFHIAMNHPFRDGNKRTAFAAMVVFLRMNGWNLELPDESAASLFLQMIEEARKKAWLAERLGEFSRRRVQFELRDFFQSAAASHMEQIRDAFVRTPLHSASAELAASFEEAALAMPILHDLNRRAAQLIREGNERDAETATNQIVLLMLLHRCAEDLGYEW